MNSDLVPMKRLELTARASPMTKSLLKATGGATFTTHWTAVGGSVVTADMTAVARVESGSAVVVSVHGSGAQI